MMGCIYGFAIAPSIPISQARERCHAHRVTRFALLLLAACGSHAAPRDGDVRPVVVVVAADAASCSAGAKLDNGACAKDADCVLTELPTACDACSLGQLYVVPTSALAAREERCRGIAPCSAGCPAPDTYTRAFYRAECRNRRCIAWRWHSGG